jgi:hypothetical protein
MTNKQILKNLKNVLKKTIVEERLAECTRKHGDDEHEHDFDCESQKGYSLTWEEDCSKNPFDYPENDGFINIYSLQSKKEVFNSLENMLNKGDLEGDIVTALSNIDPNGERYFRFRLFKFLEKSKMNKTILKMREDLQGFREDLRESNSYLAYFRNILSDLNSQNSFHKCEIIKKEIEEYFGN